MWAAVRSLRINLIYRTNLTDWRACSLRPCWQYAGLTYSVLIGLTGCVSMQRRTLEHEWANWFIDVNMGVFLTEPDFEGRVVPHCLEKGEVDFSRNINRLELQSLTIFIRDLFAKEKDWPKFNACLNTPLRPHCSVFVYCPCNSKNEQTSMSHDNKPNKQAKSLRFVGQLRVSFNADNTR